MAFVWELTKETIVLPLGCLQGGGGGAPLRAERQGDVGQEEGERHERDLDQHARRHRLLFEASGFRVVASAAGCQISGIPADQLLISSC